MTSSETKSPQAVVDFWHAAGPGRWFRKNPAFDADFGRRFHDAHFAAARREHDAWADTPEGALALLILLDQYPRNVYRGTGHMYATDPLARHYAGQAVDNGFDTSVQEPLRPFFYLPFMHSELLDDQLRSLELNAAMGEQTVYFAQEHHRIISRFGRFPHRNRELGRPTTADEQAFLDAGGFAG